MEKEDWTAAHQYNADKSFFIRKSINKNRHKGILAGKKMVDAFHTCFVKTYKLRLCLDLLYVCSHTLKPVQPHWSITILLYNIGPLQHIPPCKH